MFDSNPPVTEERRIFMILSPRSLPYACDALESLFSNALEPLHLHLITDSTADKELILEETAKYSYADRCSVLAKGDIDDREADVFGTYPNLRRFRNGHPCWRKITDPLLLSHQDDEIIVLDPDLYFPNRFSFEKTPYRGLLLMWQKPNCLLPATMVSQALRKKIALAHHVDIGVAQWRANIDLEWLEWLVDQIGVGDHPDAASIMHIELVVWAAIAMREGGGYLPPQHWLCWRRSQPIRLLRKLHVPGPQLLRGEPFSTMKCFHAGGEAKYWLGEAKQRGWLESHNLLDQPGSLVPFVELTPRAYSRDQALKAWLKRIGYYGFFPNGALQ